MSIDLHLYCKATQERVAVLRCGRTATQQMDANVVASFLAYHADLGVQGASEFILRNASDDDLDDTLLWTVENARELLGRAPQVLCGQDEFEAAPSGGLWVLRTVDGRL